MEETRGETLHLSAGLPIENATWMWDTQRAILEERLLEAARALLAHDPGGEAVVIRLEGGVIGLGPREDLIGALRKDFD